MTTPPMNDTMDAPSLFLAVLAGGALISTAPTQEPAPTSRKAVAWPELNRQQKERLEELLAALNRSNVKPEATQRSMEALIALGPGVCPRLLRRITDAKDGNINHHLFQALDRLLTEDHADLLVEYADRKHASTRLYILKRLVDANDKKFVPVYKKATADKNPDIVYHAQLGMARTALDTTALDYLFLRCRDEWPKLGTEITAALSVARDGDGDGMVWLRKKLENQDYIEQLAGLRMMRALATKADASRIARFLDSHDATLKKEAINTLRVVIDGHQPLSLREIPAFNLVKLCKDWKARVNQ